MSPASRGRPGRSKRRGPTPRRRPAERETESSSRYTPPAPPEVRFRPGWHKVVGWLQIAAGLAVVALHYGLGLQVLPGGHNDGWLVIGFVVAAGGTWWLGVFDRPAGRW